MFTGDEIATAFASLGITHVVTVPDSTIGRWEPDIEARGIRLVRVCREGEAWSIAGGLHMAGATPLVMIQCTGLFESGDSLRNIVHDWRLPILAVIGYRSYLSQETIPGDTCLRFTEPVLDAWQMPVKFLRQPGDLPGLVAHLGACKAEGRAGVALIAEGKA